MPSLPRLAAVGLGLSLACGSPPPRSEPAPDASPAIPTSPAPAPADCRVEPLRAELASYCEFDVGIPALALAAVPWSAPTYHPIASTVVSIERAGVRDPDAADPAPVHLEAWLAAPPRRLAEPGELVIAIAGDVPLTTVAALVRGLADAGREHLLILVHARDPRPLPRPRDPERLAGLREGLPASKPDRVRFIAGAVRGIATACPPIAEAFAKLQQNPVVGERCARLAELASAAIVECGCANADAALTVLYALTIGFVPPSGWTAALEISIDRESAHTGDETATWASFVAANARPGEPLRLWFE